MRLLTLGSWAKSRTDPLVPLGDARTIIAGVLGLLLASLALFQQTTPEAELFRLLRDLPPEVRVVLIEPSAAQPSRLSNTPSPNGLVVSLLKIPPARIPAEVPRLATLVIEDAKGSEESVTLVEQSVVQRFGLHGVEVGGLVALGNGSPLLAVRLQEKRSAVSPTLLRELRAAPGVRVLVRTVWVMRRFPALPQPSEQELMALWVQGDSRHLRAEGMLPKEIRSLGISGYRLLSTQPEDALLVLDGVSLSTLFPPELPPLLEAIRAETGVGPEIRALMEMLRDTPVVLIVQAQSEDFPRITAGLALTTENRQRVEAAVRTLLTRRLAIAQATVETVRADGRTIRHARPSPNRSELEETHDGPWRILRAPQAAGAHDLVAGFRDDVVILGTSPEAVREAGAVLRPMDARDSTARFFLDGALLRRVPTVAFALRGLSSELRAWTEALERVTIEVSGESRNLRFVAEIEWSPPPGVP